MIRLHLRFKHIEWVYNDLTGYRSGVQRLDWTHEVYVGDGFVFLKGVPLYSIDKKKWVKRIRPTSIIQIDNPEYKDHRFEIGWISKNDMVSIQSKNDVRVKLHGYPNMIKKVIRE